MNRNKFNGNSGPSSFNDTFGSWETNRESLDQRNAEIERAKAEERRRQEEERRRQALREGGEKYTDNLRRLVAKGDEESRKAFEDYRALDEYFLEKENGVEAEEVKENGFSLPTSEIDEAIKSNSTLSELNILASRIRNAESEEARSKFLSEYSKLTAQFNATGFNKADSQYSISNASIYYKGQDERYKNAILDELWSRTAKREEIRQTSVNVDPKMSAEINDSSFDEEGIADLDFLSKGGLVEKVNHQDKIAQELQTKLSGVSIEFPEDFTVSRNGGGEASLSRIERNSNRKWDKMKKWGSKVFKIALVAAALFGANYAKETIDDAQREDRIEQRGPSSESKYREMVDGVDSPAGAFGIDSESAMNNRIYDSRYDSFYDFSKKESKGSLGVSIENIEDSNYVDYLKNKTEDSLSFKGQFFRMNEELSKDLLGMNYEDVENLIDKAEKGDRESFRKLDDAYDKLMEQVSIVEGKKTIDGSFDSIYRIQEDDGTWTYKLADDINIGGTYRTVKTIVNGKEYSFDIRDQCQQLIVRGLQVKIPTMTLIEKNRDRIPVGRGGETPPPPTTTTETPPPPKIPEPEKPTDETPPPPPVEIPEIEIDYGKDWSKQNQEIYEGIDIQEAGEVTQEVTQAEIENNVNPEIQPGSATEAIKAENVDSSIDVSNIENVPQEYAGETTAEAQAQSEANEAGTKIEADAKAQYEAEQGGGLFDNLTPEQIEAIQNGVNQSQQ